MPNRKIPNMWNVKPLIKEEESIIFRRKSKPVVKKVIKPKRKKKMYCITTVVTSFNYYHIEAYDEIDAENRFYEDPPDIDDSDIDHEEVDSVEEC